MESIYALLKDLPGTIGLYYKDLSTGREICYNEDVQFISASVIKLPIMMDVYMRAERGELSLKDLLSTKDYERFPGAGAILSIEEDFDISIQSLVNLMINISDNTATNMLINYIGVEKMKQGFAEMGLIKTELNRAFYDMELLEKGIHNYIAPKEIGGLLESLYHETFISPEASRAMIRILKSQQFNHKIPDRLPPGTVVANKTGDIDGITHDAGIVYGDKPFIFVFASMEGNTSASNNVLREAAKICYDLSNAPVV